MTRPNWDEYGLGIAKAVSARGDCTRRQVGAVILDLDHRIIGSGYNGTAPGGPSCLKGECPRGLHYLAEPSNCRQDWSKGFPRMIGRCACGNDWPCVLASKPGSSYDTGPGICISTHAELNALMDVDARWRLAGASMFITDEWCDGCKKIVTNTTRLADVVWPTGSWTIG